MRCQFILAGAVFACSAALPMAAAQAAPQKPIVVAENDKKGQHNESGGQQGQQGGGQQGRGHNAPAPGQNTGGQPGGHNNMMMDRSHMTPSFQNGQNTQGEPGSHHDHKAPKFTGVQNTGGQNPGGQSGGGNMMMGHNRGHGHDNFDRHTYQRNVTATRHFHFHGGGYVRPSGWYYRRWVFGEILPTFFWTQNYWISDYYDYDLPDPPPGFVWVRYGDDALLVNEDTGEVLQVDYGLFA